MIYSVPFRRVFDNGIRYYRVEFARLVLEDDLSNIVLGFKDVDEEVRKEQQIQQALREAIAAAKASNMAKTTFLSNMSHEIRTPMNAIIGLDNIALNEPGLTPHTKEQLEKIGASARHLLGIINDILDMSRIESGRMELRDEEFSFREFLDQINVMVGGQCADKGLHYECKIIGKTEDYYIGDEMKLKQVLINILGNAVKFTPAQGTVTFTVEQAASFEDHRSLRFIISDTGIGMNKEYIPRIFEAFSQEREGASNKLGSTGLGMATTKNPNDEQGDTISAGLVGSLVLVAEDMELKAEILMELLDMEEIRSERAENGQIAVDMFSEHPAGYYDAILMDIRMPVMDGLEATRAIRALDRPDAKSIPIIAMTANAFAEDVQQSLQAGMSAHLSKPVEPERLYETLGRMIR
ncbi:MAG: response regulator [Coriobacteriales bacterium]|nr:response regulator [Coriobacteriales bacterium]